MYKTLLIRTPRKLYINTFLELVVEYPLFYAKYLIENTINYFVVSMMNRFVSLFLFIGLACGKDDPNPERFKINPEGNRVFIDLFRLWDKKYSYKLI